MVPPGRTIKAGIAAETEVVPSTNGRNATPPLATEAGENDCPSGINTVRVAPEPVDVTRSPGGDGDALRQREHLVEIEAGLDGEARRER